MEIEQCVGCTDNSSRLLGDGAAVLAPSSGEEPASPRHRAGVASMACRSTRRFSTERAVKFDFPTGSDGAGHAATRPWRPCRSAGRARPNTVGARCVERQVDFHVAGRLALVRQRQLAGHVGLEDAAPARRRLRPAALDRGAHAALAVPRHRGKPQRDGALGLDRPRGSVPSSVAP